MKGIKYCNDKSIRYEQTENSIESIIKKIKQEYANETIITAAKHGVENQEFLNDVYIISNGFLESCGPGAMATLMEGMDYLNINNYFRFPTGKQIQMDDAITVHMNDPRNDYYYQSGDEMDNRYFNSYIIAAKLLFNCQAFLLHNITFEKIVGQLIIGNGVQVMLNNPKHFIALVGYESESNTIKYHDPYGSRKTGKPDLLHKGIFEDIGKNDFENIYKTAIIYTKKG
jgi:hypothetical protein